MSNSLLSKAARVARHRPTRIYQLARGYLLFMCTRFLRRVFPPPGTTFGRNVRLQRLSGVLAEHPHATISIGDHAIIYEDSRIEAYGKGAVSLGAQSIMGGAKINARYRISIGERFLASWNIFIQDFDPHPVDASLRAAQVASMVSEFRPRFDGAALNAPPITGWEFPGDEIVIGDDVWVGANATILKGAKIGKGSIVASGAVVLKGEYPDHSLIAGNPAKAVKKIE